MGEILPDGTIQGYQNYCPVCNQVIDVNAQGTELYPKHECKKNGFILRFKNEDSESDKYGYVVRKNNGVSITTPFKEKAKLFESKKLATEYCIEKNIVDCKIVAKK